MHSYHRSFARKRPFISESSELFSLPKFIPKADAKLSAILAIALAVA